MFPKDRTHGQHRVRVSPGTAFTGSVFCTISGISHFHLQKQHILANRLHDPACYRYRRYKTHKCLHSICPGAYLRKNTRMGVSEQLANAKAKKAAANLLAGQEFLATNKNKTGIVELPSGLQYEILTEGSGPRPNEMNTVTCHYHGTLIDGTIFDSSVQRGRPASFPLNMVIRGWTEGLQLMPTGSKWRFYIPPHLGYGDRQVSAQIGPNATLVFDVELISFS